jgi:N-acetylmuramoyl-L-alanine amidase
MKHFMNFLFILLSMITVTALQAEKRNITKLQQPEHGQLIAALNEANAHSGNVIVLKSDGQSMSSDPIPANSPSKDYKIRTIVLDAGHGGKDAGCTGVNGTYEKTLNLEYALMLGKKIKAAYPDINIIYTRDSDEFIELHERASIANKHNADLFISIHCNWNKNSAANGMETYVLGLHRAKDNLEVAKRENASIFLENNYQKNYQGFDPNSPDGNILINMSQNANLDQSISLADKIQSQFDQKRNNRGVRQAGFLVLRQTSMPAILVETGFLSNPGDQNFMTSDKGKDFIVSSMFNGFNEYKSLAEFDYHPVSSKASVVNYKPITIPGIKGKVEFCVQLQASSHILDVTTGDWVQFPNIIARNENGLYKYQALCKNYDDAVATKEKAKANGFPNAFVCAYKDGIRLSLDDALKATSDNPDNK